MSARQPFSMVPHGDVLARVSDLEGDEIALYMVAYFLMLERRGPIADDIPWLGRKAGISTRRANQIKAKLVDQGKWQVRGEQLGDTAALEIIDRANRRSAINRSNALARWEQTGQPELDLTAPKAGNGRQKSRKSAVSADANASAAAPADAPMQNAGKNGDNPEINGGKTQEHVDLIEPETAEIRHSPPEFRMPDSRARATPELELENDHTTDSVEGHPRAIDGADPPALLQAVLEASGFRPHDDAAHAQALEQVTAWAADRISFDRVVLPTVRAIIARTDDPTSSLRRFDRHVRLTAAKARPTPEPPPAPARHPPPAAGDDAEADQRLIAIRTALRRDCGARTYDGWLKPIRFTVDGTILIANLPSQFMRDWVHEHFGERLGRDAAAHGFTAVHIAVAAQHHTGPHRRGGKDDSP